MENGKIAEKIRTDRRGLLKSILTAGFAAPVISTFTMNSLMAQSSVLGVTSASNMTPVAVTGVCRSANGVITKQQLTNVGYAGPVYFQGHGQEVAQVQGYRVSAGLPQVVTNLCPAAPSRLTVALTLQVMQNGPAAGALTYRHYLRSDVTILSSVITVNAQTICSLMTPNGQVQPTDIKYYSDLPALLEEMAHGHATLEMMVLYQGYQINLIGDIRSAPQPTMMTVLTS